MRKVYTLIKPKPEIQLEESIQIEPNYEFNINNISSAAFGLPVGFLVMVVVSLVTPAPSKELQQFIDDCRRPKGKTLMDEKSGLVAAH
jgi:Na+(H+)/acetate symporter ActP